MTYLPVYVGNADFYRRPITIQRAKLPARVDTLEIHNQHGLLIAHAMPSRNSLHRNAVFFYTLQVCKPSFTL